MDVNKWSYKYFSLITQLNALDYPNTARWAGPAQGLGNTQNKITKSIITIPTLTGVNWTHIYA